MGSRECSRGCRNHRFTLLTSSARALWSAQCAALLSGPAATLRLHSSWLRIVRSVRSYFQFCFRFFSFADIMNCSRFQENTKVEPDELRAFQRILDITIECACFLSHLISKNIYIFLSRIVMNKNYDKSEPIVRFKTPEELEKVPRHHTRLVRGKSSIVSGN